MNSLQVNDLTTISHILAAGLAAVPVATLDLPLEVAQQLDEARAQMKCLPEVIDNLNQASHRFQTVAAALTGMMDLADQAAAEDTDDENRSRLNDEFIDLAKVVAADAGRHLYAGPSLKLSSRGQALSAARIVRYMSPVIDTMARELEEQKQMIHEAIEETISFLRIVAQCYPEAAGAPTLNLLVQATRPFQKSSSAPAGLLH